MNPVGRPREIDREKLLADLDAYIATTDIPILARFAVNQGLHRQQLYEIPELSDAIKRCANKKEAALEEAGLAGTVNVTMAIFSLKQLGWKDAQKFEHSGPDGGPILSKNVNADDLTDEQLAVIASAGRAAPVEPETGED
jgi:hypothetical protein